jgi:hypothetical protein
VDAPDPAPRRGVSASAARGELLIALGMEGQIVGARVISTDRQAPLVDAGFVPEGRAFLCPLE